VTEHADVSEHCGGHLNDMVVDASGRAYVGNFGWDLMGGAHPAPTVLVRVDPDGSMSVVAEDLVFPNGSVITPDGGTLIVAETFGGRFSVFGIAEDGSLGERAVWQVGPRSRSARSRRCCRRPRSRPTASHSTRKGRCGPPTACRRAAAGSRRVAKSSRRSRCRKV
jgi:hypothetical protein